LNLGLWAYKAGTLLLEQHLQSGIKIFKMESNYNIDEIVGRIKK
jgi:hypothetical protein